MYPYRGGICKVVVLQLNSHCRHWANSWESCAGCRVAGDKQLQQQLGRRLEATNRLELELEDWQSQTGVA